MRKWAAVECDWGVISFSGFCSICTKPANCYIKLEKYIGLHKKDRLLCKDCLSKFIKGDINI